MAGKTVKRFYETKDEAKARMKRLIRGLKKTYPDAHCALHFETPFQLLSATILSAQCTDKRVNEVTPVLFARYGTAEEMSGATQAEIEKIIRPTGFYKNKAQSLLEMSTTIVKLHGGKVPNKMEDLIQLRGVGRKTANVILGNAFGIPGLVVDTHVTRLSNRFGFTRSKDAVVIERELMEIVPKKDWTMYSHLLISHGREVCTARKARCADCSVSKLCPKVGL